MLFSSSCAAAKALWICVGHWLTTIQIHLQARWCNSWSLFVLKQSPAHQEKNTLVFSYLDGINLWGICFFLKAPILPLFKISLQRHFPVSLTLRIFIKTQQDTHTSTTINTTKQNIKSVSAEQASQVYESKCALGDIKIMLKHCWYQNLEKHLPFQGHNGKVQPSSLQTKKRNHN